jgi:hypothetical protein
MKEIKIFLSSTYVDLKDARQLIMKLLGVLRSDLISMEFFGSDESKPKEYCLGQVKQSNLFVGLYAERYGSIDLDTGLSLTELEYLAALHMFESGEMSGLLIYVLDPKASWPLEFIDRDQLRVEKLSDLKRRLCESHTVSFFKTIEDLPLMVLRDVIRKVEIGTRQALRPRRQPRTSLKSALDHPVGMEFYTEEQTALFQGRSQEIEDLVGQILRHRTNLLIGPSGIGKTSLLNAGLFPALRKIGWSIAIVRPLTNPLENLRRSVWSQLMEGMLHADLDFSTVVRTAAEAHVPAQTLIVIDQFEDILGPKAAADIEPLTRELVDLYRSSEQNPRLLLCYRGDAESQLGPIWQKVSGSPDGLPRLYLGPLTEEGAHEVLKSNLEALGITVNAKENRHALRLIDRVITELTGESLLAGYSGIYPPFLQMVISRMAGAKKVFTASEYEAAGGSRKIISDFLLSQLKYLGKQEQIGREILIALVSSYGTKTQKTVDEIAAETLHRKRDVEATLRLLHDLRLVRGIGRQHEIVHDFLAKTILSELVSSEDRESKKFKDLLAARAAAYADTRAGLTMTEHIRIYKHRNRILCTEDETRLLLNSHLVEGRPIHYWLRSYSKEKVIAWINSLIPEEDFQEYPREYRRNAYRLLLKLGAEVPPEEVLRRFRGHRLNRELRGLISSLSAKRNFPLLLKMTRLRSPEISWESAKALVDIVSLEDEALLADLAAKSSLHYIFEGIALKEGNRLKVGEVRGLWPAQERWKKLFALYAIGIRGTKKDLNWLLEALSAGKLNTAQKIAAASSAIRLAYRLRNHSVLKRLQKSDDNLVASTYSRMFDDRKVSLRQLLSDVPTSLSEWRGSVRDIATAKDLPLLKKALKSDQLYSLPEDIVLAICDQGGEAEFDFLFETFLKQNQPLGFYSSAPDVLVSVVALAGRRHLPLLKEIIESEAFWDWHTEFTTPIKVSDPRNVYFIKWVVGVAFAKFAGRKHMKLLRQMLSHHYWTVRNAAAEALVKLCDVSDIPSIIDDMLAAKGQQDAFMKVLREMDEHLYSPT